MTTHEKNLSIVRIVRKNRKEETRAFVVPSSIEEIRACQSVFHPISFFPSFLFFPPFFCVLNSHRLFFPSNGAGRFFPFFIPVLSTDTSFLSLRIREFLLLIALQKKKKKEKLRSAILSFYN